MDRSVRSPSKCPEIEPLSQPRSCSKLQLQDDKLDDNDFINYVDPEKSHSVSTLRKSVSQYYAVTITSLLAVTYGFSIGFTTIVTHELRNDTRIVDVTDDEITWIGSMNYFSTPLGAIAGGPIAQLIGRKNTLLLMAVPCTLSWMLISYSDSVHAILLAFFVLGAVGGMVDPALQVYVAEVCEPRLRGGISCFVTTTIMFGVFLETIFGLFVDWRNLAICSGLTPLLGLLLIGFIPESPYWLASQGRLKEAERSLCRLRGWTTAQLVEREFKEIAQSAAVSESRSVSIWSRDFARRLLRRAVLVPFALVNFAFFVSCFNGSTSILTYVLDTFERLESPIDIHTATIIFTALQLLGSVLLPFIVPRTGKRGPTFGSLIVTGCAYLVVAVYVFMRDQGVIEVSRNQWLAWIPLVTIEISVIATTLGIETTPWILVSEVFPGDVRDCATGIVTSTGFIYAALASKTYFTMLSGFTLAGTFLFFAAVNYVGFVVLYYFMPETEGRSLVEIEEHFAGKRKLDKRPGTEGTELVAMRMPLTKGCGV